MKILRLWCFLFLVTTTAVSPAAIAKESGSNNENKDGHVQALIPPASTKAWQHQRRTAVSSRYPLVSFFVNIFRRVFGLDDEEDSDDGSDDNDDSDGNDPSTIPPSFPCTCTSCTEEVWNRPSGGTSISCGDRIKYLQEAKAELYPAEEYACIRVAGLEFPEECGLCDPFTCDGRVRESYCGCEDSCSPAAWQSDTGGVTCGSRVEWVQTNDQSRQNEQAACQRVASEFPATACGQLCNPTTCNGGNGGEGTPLYCFLAPEDRVRYENVWTDYLVEVKDSSSLSVCGPSSNKFTNGAVAMSDEDELTLKFQYVDGQWEAAEVRIIRMDESAFSYGSYEFSVKSVTVKNRVTGAVTSNHLPISLVLGLFTWDPTDDYSIHENWNHEVDIEISQWNDPDNEDAQFLVQPPGSPQQHRFFSGIGDTTSQSGHRWKFDWNPGQVDWSTTAGAGQSHSYSTEQASLLGLSDYVQCLPANVEVRINLWNIGGTGTTPTGLATDEVVEVVIDDFVYTPSGLTGVKEGGYCSKDCQCMDSSVCLPAAGVCSSS